MPKTKYILMPCKSSEFKSFNKRIRRTLCSSKRPMLFQSSKLISNYFKLETHSLSNIEVEIDRVIERLAIEGYISPCNMLTALIYIIRLKKYNGKEFQQFTASELYLCSLVLATKFLNDGNIQEFVWNDEWAQASGFSLTDLNELEIRLLNALNWDVYISEESFYKVLTEFEIWTAKDSTMRNGTPITYNELFLLSNENVSIREVLISLLKWFFNMVALYATMIGGLFVVGTALETIGRDLRTAHQNFSIYPTQSDMLNGFVSRSNSTSSVAGVLSENILNLPLEVC